MLRFEEGTQGTQNSGQNRGPQRGPRPDPWTRDPVILHLKGTVQM